MACCDVVNRGAAYAAGRIIYNLLDDCSVAVHAVSGRQLWRTRLGDVRRGETTPGAPLIIRDKVIVGNAGGELGIRGWVMALDVYTGKVLWKACNTGADADVKANQLTPHDGRDYGGISESTVIDLTLNGVRRRVLVHFDKNGFAYTLDAKTGEVLVAEKFAHVTWADHVDKTTGVPAVVPGKEK